MDGAFTFEGPHDVFTPLVLAATATTSLELATNVAIAFPRNPVQLAHQAYDLQTAVQGAVHSRARHPDPGPGREALRRLVRPAHRPDARAGRRPAGHLRHAGRPATARLPRRVHRPHPDAARPSTRDPTRSGCRPSPSAGWVPRWCAWPPKWPTACWSCRSTPARHFHQRTAPGHRGRPGAWRPGPRSELTVTAEVIVCCGRDDAEMEAAAPGRALAARLLRVDAGLPAGPRGRGVGGPPARAQ